VSAGDLQWQLQRYLFALLSADPVVQSAASRSNPPVLKVGVFDWVPDGYSQFPYIVIGENDSMDLGDKSAPGEDVQATIMLFSRDKSNNELQVMSQQIKGLLHEKHVIIPDGGVSLCRFFHSTNRRLSDGFTRERILKYQFHLTELLPQEQP
jgi:hypothetical protein